MKIAPKEYGHEYDEDSPLDALAVELERKLSQTMSDRTAIDHEMVIDLRNYHGQYDAATLAAMKEAKRANPFIKMTRAKTNAAESQIVDLLFPNDDKNWGIAPTPVPELADQASNEQEVLDDNGEPYTTTDGEQVTEGMLAARELEQIKERCDKMELLIEDQLVESRFNAVARLAIHDGCVVGTGILKGPVVVNKMDKSFTKQGDAWVVEMRQSITPAVEVVRPWDFFPDLSASRIEEAEFIFERRYMSKQQIKGLIDKRGFPKAQIKKIMQMSPQSTQHSSTYMDDVRTLAGLSDNLNDTRYETWEYHGPIPYSVLFDLGVIDLPSDEKEAQLFIQDMMHEEVMATVFYCGGIVLGAKLHMMHYENYMPYRVWNWEQDDSCIFGYGLPRIVRDEQRIINSTWRMILDNGSITAGPQVIFDNKYIRPANGDATIEPFKQWHLLKPVDDVRKVFSTIEFNSHLPELQGIYSMARQMMDEVSGVPMLNQGEQGQSTQTLGGMSMLMNAANAVRRRQIKQWDDNITAPLITDFYAWNMEYEEDNDVKGDYQVDARGTSALLVRETQAVALTNYLSMAGSNPVFAPVIQLKAIENLRQWVKLQGLPADLVPTNEELEAYQQQQAEQQGEQPQDTAIAVEQLRIQQMQAKQEFEMQMFQRKAELDMQENEASRNLKAQQMQADLMANASKERIEIMKLEQTGKVNTEKLLVELKKVQMQTDKEMQQFMTELKLKQVTGNYRANDGLAQ
ncbi:hypothetical protein [Rheinheimera sp. MMS21-TC3]|uniref:portal protein n=1 Tax=Rheinheimera sp. MMS21-TC3 TaxID=3072790 RepID=UPI0028C50DDE|nr:hypothetical protein [Rheinheimera sp. MMS21-TC3]WNO60438.1 hypothetical protein RDV63_05590 [Rheinheimera sp. MMS21-TC3]